MIGRYKKKLLTLFVWLSTGMSLVAVPNINPDKMRYLSFPYLKNIRSCTTNALHREGFQRVVFNTEDNKQLCGLYLRRNNARYNMVFMPGLNCKKEFEASYYALLNEDCNVLLLDPRGQGESEGKWLFNLWTYGIREYKDVIAAIEYMQQQDTKPIFVHGMCAGSYHAARAMVVLHQRNALNRLQVKGIVFDSGWTSVNRTFLAGAQGKMNEFLLKGVAGLNGSTRWNSFWHNPLFTFLSEFASSLLNSIYNIFFKRDLENSEQFTNLLQQVQVIGGMPVPVLYIHSYDDFVTSINPVQELSNLTPRKICWWIPATSKHSRHHINYPHAYAQYQEAFIEQYIQ